MFRKILFVFVLAAAVLAFAGYSVPTASACSTSVPDDCRAIFGPNFDAVQEVPAAAPALTATGTSSSIQSTGATATTSSAAPAPSDTPLGYPYGED